WLRPTGRKWLARRDAPRNCRRSSVTHNARAQGDAWRSSPRRPPTVRRCENVAGRLRPLLQMLPVRNRLALHLAEIRSRHSPDNQWRLPPCGPGHGRAAAGKAAVRVASDNVFDQRVSVCGLLWDWRAEGEGIAAGFVGGEVEMVGSDCCY